MTFFYRDKSTSSNKYTKRSTVFLNILVLMIASCASSNLKKETVFLVHGLGRTKLSMVVLKNQLKEKGYHVVNVNYPSRKHDVDYLAEEYLGKKVLSLDTTEKIHFVGHSLGCILIRQFLAEYSLSNLGRVVMLTPPNNGSEIIDVIGHLLVVKKILGPAAAQLNTSSRGKPKSLGKVSYEVGVIMGSRSVIPFFQSLLPGENDGVVLVEGGKIEGMKDFIVLEVGHSFIMYAPEAQKQVIHFLEKGEFLLEKEL